MGSSSSHLAAESAEKELHKEYSGRSGFQNLSIWHRYRRPEKTGPEFATRLSELEDGTGEYQEQRFRNPDGDNHYTAYPGVDKYYSTTKKRPRKLLVQAAHPDKPEDKLHRDWNVCEINSRVPWVIRLAELCLNPLQYRQDRPRAENTNHNEAIDGMGDRRTPNEGERPVWERLGGSILHYLAATVCTMLFAWIIQVMLSLQIVTSPWMDDSEAPYQEYENMLWNWPKYAVNVLDQVPPTDHSPLEIARSRVAQLAIPRRLMVKDENTGQYQQKEGEMVRDEKTGRSPPRYIFLSFSRNSFEGYYTGCSDPEREQKLGEYLRQVADALINHENRNLENDENKRASENLDPEERRVKAFWLDMDCVSPTAGPQKTEDIHNICDAVRCAMRVYVVLPNDEQKQTWGRRIWTLPEALLAGPDDKLRLCVWDPAKAASNQVPNTFPVLSLTDIYQNFLCKPDLPPPQGQEQHSIEDVTGHLIEHFTGTTTLSELQLFTCAIQALAHRTEGKSTEGHTTADLAYAAMGLLAYRIPASETDDPFQAVARLSLENDSNRLLERLACLWPHPIPERPDATVTGSQSILGNIADRDQYCAHLWDIQPICDVVGIGDDKYTPTVILDRCRAIPIRWKGFPRVSYAKNLAGFRASLSQGIVYIGAWLLVTGFGLFPTAAALFFATTNYETPNFSVSMYLIGAAIFLGAAWIVSWFSPLAVRQLSNGGPGGVSCHLIGFEGTLSLAQIEKAIYGNCNHRLTYAPSSSTFSQPDATFRWGWEPKPTNLPPSQRLFTIVDTGDLTVFVIAAERPPVVAVICGHEGGEAPYPPV
ncbi:hypothetical protein N7449_002558 [Penicillium cf. viridicatum]|uniref:Heterokaryon incompatibility domain-containing protein n=1 Tax=Penicillium cf. viridicatum TaxID=2972119 RepID=A0A9W9MVM0_9EURO|nr:hypothetical protein N7449_002558 [Penicillium cf. viridicatum]